MVLPLDGLRVVDMATDRAELCGRLLADLGADVVRLEPPGGAPSRRVAPFTSEHESLFFEVRNSNKRSAVADLDTPEGRDRLLELLARADVWLETTRPGRLESVGLDPILLAEQLPQLVVASITDFGRTGPYRDFEATDDVITGLAGEIFRSGVVGRPPLLPPGSFAFDVAGVMAAFAVLTAYWQLLATGQGQHIDFSILEAVAQSTDWSLPNYSAIVNQGGPYIETRAGSGIVYPLYPCRDGYVRLVILSPRQWHAMRAWLGDPEFLQDPHWDSLLGRMSIQEDILDPMYVELFSTMGMSELSDEAQKRGIVMTPVMDPRSVLEAEHYRERGAFSAVDMDGGRTGRLASGFLEMGGRRLGFRRRAPRLAEHDGDVERSWPDRRPAPATPDTATLDTATPDTATLDTATPDTATLDTATPDTAMPPARPLEGLLVADFGHGGVGVEAGRLLAEYGAEVIKVESRSYPDFIRLVAGSEMSPSFASSNRSKKSLGVDVKTPEGLELVKRLVARADVVIENNSAGTMADLGLGYEVLRELNPRLVMVSSQLMGSTGTWASWLGYGPSTRPAGGMTWLWNFPDGGPPPGAAVIFPDHLVGRICAIAALSGLVQRRSVGAGAHFEAAQVETVLGTMSQFFLQESLDPGSVAPLGNRRPHGAPWGVYQCAGDERWCVITVRDDHDWKRLCRVLGRADWAGDAGLSSLEGRRARHDELDAGISEWTGGRSDRAVMELLQAAGVPAGTVAYASDQPGDPHLVARGYLVEIDQPGVGRMILEGPAFRATGMAPPLIAPAPALGQHTRDIARDHLGLDEAEIDRLLQAGVIETA